MKTNELCDLFKNNNHISRFLILVLLHIYTSQKPRFKIQTYFCFGDGLYCSDTFAAVHISVEFQDFLKSEITWNFNKIYITSFVDV